MTEMLLDRHIEIMPGVRSGKPRIAGTRIAVADVAIKHLELGQPLEEIARKFHLSLAAVYAGMAYYYDHRAEIDRSIAEDEAFVEASKCDNPSILQEKLKKLRGG